jgi:DNA repair protein RecO (recombination protein O)
MAGPTTITNLEGYVIHHAQFKENDAMVSVLSKEGLVSFLARGVLKTTSKNAASCQLLSYSRFSLIAGKGGGYSLKESEVLTMPDGKDSLERLTAFSFLAEVSNKLIQADEAEEAYPFLDAAMKAIASGVDAFTEALLYFSHVLLIAGYGLDVDECVYCQSKSGIAGISYADGGFVCKEDLQEGVEACDPRKLKILRYAFRCKVEDFPRVSFGKDECQDLLRELCQYANDLTGVSLKSLELLLKA